METITINLNTLNIFKNLNSFVKNNPNINLYFNFSEMGTEKVFIHGIQDSTNNKNLIKSFYPGGIVIISPQDWLFLYTGNHCSEGVIKENISKLILILNKKFNEYQFTLNHNDIVVNNIYKIGSFSSWECDGIWSTGLLFFFEENQSEINIHCHKTQKYQSVGINNLNIDIDMVKNEINRLFKVDLPEQYERIQNEHKTKIKQIPLNS